MSTLTVGILLNDRTVLKFKAHRTGAGWLIKSWQGNDWSGMMMSMILTV